MELPHPRPKLAALHHTVTFLCMWRAPLLFYLSSRPYIK